MLLIHLKANTASINVWLFYPNLNKTVWPLWSYLVAWRKPHSPICWGPLGPQSTRWSGWGSRVKPSHCCALCDAAKQRQANTNKSNPVAHFCNKKRKEKYPTLDDLAESQLSIRRSCLDLTSSSLCRFRGRKQNTSYICWTWVACGHHLASGLDGKRVSSTMVGLFPLAGKLIPFFCGWIPWSSPGGKWGNSTQASSKWHAPTMTTHLWEQVCEIPSADNMKPKKGEDEGFNADHKQ